MRLCDPATSPLQKLPPPPGPIRMYFCGPTVYQRIHIGNARPFVISLWLKRWLEETGYRVLLAENITDINDQIYAAAPSPQRRLRLARLEVESKRNNPTGARTSLLRPEGERDGPGDPRLDRNADR